MNKFSFEKLDVWQKAKEFTVDIYSVTSTFHNAEKFGLVSLNSDNRPQTTDSYKLAGDFVQFMFL